MVGSWFREMKERAAKTADGRVENDDESEVVGQK
jgi:hypothetical protein